ncbi:MAG: glycosyltransferase [Nitrospirae bacterium]|nr:glycosyltransferase [Nitrospirota bacterium]
MNCYNSSKYLREAIESVYAQTRKDWEIIFWDNASTDNSGEIAKSYGPGLRYFRGETTVPLYAARNFALKEARGRYIAFLDCDDMWLPEKLEEQIPLFERDEEVGLVYTDCILFNDRGKEKRLFDSVTPHRGKVFDKLLFCNFINTQTVMIRRDAIEDPENFFDSRLTFSGDYDAYLRISHKSKADYLDKPMARYRVHGGSVTSRKGRRLLVDEIDFNIESLKKNIPDFENRYRKGLKFMERRRDIQASLLDWEDGGNKRARGRIRPFIFKSIYCSALYFLMFFPYRVVFKPLHRFYKKNPLSDMS